MPRDAPVTTATCPDSFICVLPNVWWHQARGAGQTMVAASMTPSRCISGTRASIRGAESLLQETHQHANRRWHAHPAGIDAIDAGANGWILVQQHLQLAVF